MKIDELPVEMLMKIFSYLPSYKNVSLTNKVFYSIACTTNDPNICLRISSQMSFHLLESIRQSERKILKVEIRELLAAGVKLDQELVNSIMENYSASIKSLKYVRAEISESSFLKILALIPNVEHLDLQYLRDKRESLLKLHCTDDLALMKMKSLAIDGVEFLSVFNRLPVGVLTELKVDRYNCESLMALVNRQLNIKELSLGHLDLRGSSVSSVEIAAVLSKLPKLKSLTLAHQIYIQRVQVDARIMDAVSDLLELEMLAMDVSDTPEQSFANIRKLKNLKHLTLRLSWFTLCCRAKLKLVAESDNTSLITLAIGGRFEMAIDLLIALAQSAPHLKHFKISSASYSIRTVLVDVILKHFNFVEDLNIGSIHCAPSTDRNGCYNPKLGSLTFYCSILYGLWLTKFSFAYQNLRKLTLNVRRYEHGPIKSILNGFTKLESLTLTGSNLHVDDLDYLCEHKGNLKYVSIKKLNKNTLTDELLEKMHANFDVVIVDLCRPLFPIHKDIAIKLASDIRTIQCERE